MKKLLLLFAIIITSALCPAQEILDIPKPTKETYIVRNIFDSCQFRGHNLDNVKVRIVREYENPTFKVRQVEYNEDITVRFIENTRSLNSCGQWYIVNGKAWSHDFTVAFVTHGEDFTIRISTIL